MNYIMYCCFGDYKYFVEMIYSIQSFIKTNYDDIEKYTIVIFIDTIKAKDAEIELKCLGIKYIIEAIPNQKLDDWVLVNGKKYMPRLKIKAIDYFFKKYKTEVLLLDTDTVVLHDLLPIFLSIRNGSCFLYTKCLSIEDFYNSYSAMISEKSYYDLLFHYRLCKRIKKDGIFLLNDERIHISSDFQQFNSGVIGIPYSVETLLDSILNLSDYLFHYYCFYWSEEFAFSYFLQEKYSLFSCDRSVYHYSSDKWCRLLLGRSLDKSHIDTEDKNSLIFEMMNKNIPERINLLEIPNLVKKANDESNIERIPYYDNSSLHVR